MLAEIRKIKKVRAEAVLDCAIDPSLFECHEMLMDIMPTNKKACLMKLHTGCNIKRLANQMKSRGQKFRTIDIIPQE
jgi:hypothetical protein